jgi:transcriptional regulator with XRE-family HTH domain
MRKKQPLTGASSRSADDYATFVDLLTTVRVEAEVTQAALGARVGRPQTWVAKVEAGTRRIDVVELLTILDALKVSHVDFLSRLRREIRKAAR